MKHVCITSHVESIARGNNPHDDCVLSKKDGWSLVLSFGKFGGFYFYRNYSIRLCLGWIAITFIPCDIDELLDKG